jgi:hypothetical protein
MLFLPVIGTNRRLDRCGPDDLGDDDQTGFSDGPDFFHPAWRAPIRGVSIDPAAAAQRRLTAFEECDR